MEKKKKEDLEKTSPAVTCLVLLKPRAEGVTVDVKLSAYAVCAAYE